MDLNERRRGFEYQYANYYRPVQAGLETRDLYTVRGVRCVPQPLPTALSRRRSFIRFTFRRAITQSAALLAW